MPGRPVVGLAPKDKGPSGRTIVGLAPKGGAAPAKKSGGGGLLHSIEKYSGAQLVGNLGKDIGRTAVGVGPGLYHAGKSLASGTKAALTGDTKGLHKFNQGLEKTGKATAKQYKDYYGHDIGHHLYQHPLQPILDALTVASVGAGAAAKAGEIGNIDRLAKLGERATIETRSPRNIATGKGPVHTDITSNRPLVKVREQAAARNRARPSRVEKRGGELQRYGKQIQAEANQGALHRLQHFEPYHKATKGLSSNEWTALHIRAMDIHPDDLAQLWKGRPAEKIIADGRIRSLVLKPSKGMVRAEPELRSLSKAGERLYKQQRLLKDATAEARPDLTKRQAAGLLERPVREIHGDPYYFPHTVEPPKNVSPLTASGGGKALPRKLGSTKENTGALALSGKLHLRSDVLGPEFLRRVKYVKYDEIHNALRRGAVRLTRQQLERDHGGKLPKGWEYLRQNRSTRIPPTLRAEGDQHVPIGQIAGPEDRRGEYPRAGEVVDGRRVRGGDVPNMSSIPASLNDYEILPGIREVPMSDFTLSGKHYSPEGNARIADLQAQIAHNKEITPLIVVVDKEGSYILEGSTRVDALHNLGAHSFPAVVVRDEESLNEPAALDHPPTESAGHEPAGHEPLSKLIPNPEDLHDSQLAKEGFSTTDPGQAHTSSRGDYYIVPKSTVKAATGEFTRSSDFTHNFVKRPLSVWRSAVLGLRVGFLTNNLIGNSVMYAAKTGGQGALRDLFGAILESHGRDVAKRVLDDPATPPKLRGDLYKEYFPEQIQGTFGRTQSPSTSAVHTAGQAGAETYRKVTGAIPRLTSKVAEETPRRALIRHYIRHSPEFKRVYQNMPADQRKFETAARRVLEGEGPRYQRYISKQINYALGDYTHLSPTERNVLRNALPFYSWYRAIVTTTYHLAVDTPGRAEALALIGRIGADKSDQELGQVPSFLKGAVPLGNGSQGTKRVVSTQGLNPYATLEQMGRGLGQDYTSLGLNPFVEGPAQYLQRQSGNVSPLALLLSPLKDLVQGLPPSRLIAPPGPSKLYPTRKGRRAQVGGYLGVPVKEYDPNVAARQAGQGR